MQCFNHYYNLPTTTIIQVTGERIKFYNENLHKLFPSLIITGQRETKSWSM
jgi:hypothetical protein